jgi:hypothetical protein
MAPIEGERDHPRLGEETLFLNSAIFPAFSPDGRWIAYHWQVPGKTGVWVRPFSGPGGPWLVDSDGESPVWSRTGHAVDRIAGNHHAPARNRNVDNIFNGDETRLIITVHALHAFRQEPADKSDFSFYDSPAGQPTALRTCFYPGDPNGFEFVRTQPMVATASSAAPAAGRKTPARLPQHTVAGDPHAAGS